jgi:hypothetical protein
VGRELEKRENHSVVSENSQYALALGVVGVLLYIVGLPAFVIFFLGAFSFFLWKLFASGAASDTRKIFEFYLAANEILRDDDRRWYGFEVHDAIHRGERIIHSMPAAPPLLVFAVGALYLKTGDLIAAEKNLSSVVLDANASEAAIVFPSAELRDYVRILRKIERDPADAPQTSAAVRSLERIRKNKGVALLERCREQLRESEAQPHAEIAEKNSVKFVSFEEPFDEKTVERGTHGKRESGSVGRKDRAREGEFDAGHHDGYTSRKPISELLQDIFDDKVQ